MHRCLSNSTSICGTALDPSPVASFLTLLAGSFFGANCYKDTFTKLVCMKHQPPLHLS